MCPPYLNTDVNLVPRYLYLEVLNLVDLCMVYQGYRTPCVVHEL
jgi:hypothetical protein